MKRFLAIGLFILSLSSFAQENCRMATTFNLAENSMIVEIRPALDGETGNTSKSQDSGYALCVDALIAIMKKPESFESKIGDHNINISYIYFYDETDKPSDNTKLMLALISRQDFVQMDFDDQNMKITLSKKQTTKPEVSDQMDKEVKPENENKEEVKANQE